MVQEQRQEMLASRARRHENGDRVGTENAVQAQFVEDSDLVRLRIRHPSWWLDAADSPLRPCVDDKKTQNINAWKLNEV